MCFKDYHIHTVFSDGEDTPEQVVLTAIERGITEIGFSDHSYISYPADIVYWKDKDFEPVYKSEISRLKEKYKERIKILCGIEQDYYSDHPAEGYDYIIGSVHFIKADGVLVAVDEDEEYLLKNLKYFGGDIYSFAEEYYKRVAKVVDKTKCDIIGHLDLVSKYNERSSLFDETHPRYVNAWKSATDRLLKTGRPFEINMGAVARGLKTQPYPSREIINYIKEHGGKFILSSDAHMKENICFNFEKITNLQE